MWQHLLPCQPPDRRLFGVWICSIWPLEVVLLCPVQLNIYWTMARSESEHSSLSLCFVQWRYERKGQRICGLCSLDCLNLLVNSFLMQNTEQSWEFEPQPFLSHMGVPRVPNVVRLLSLLQTSSSVFAAQSVHFSSWTVFDILSWPLTAVKEETLISFCPLLWHTRQPHWLWTRYVHIFRYALSPGLSGS